MGRDPIGLGPFNKGVNLVDTVLDQGELSNCLNTRLGVRGSIGKRPGHSLYGGTPSKINGDHLVNYLYRYYKANGTKKLLGAAGGKLKYIDDVSGVWSAISINGVDANMHASNLVDSIVYKDRVYLADGLKPQRYNGTNNLYVGFFTHSAPTLTATTTGALTTPATYKYAVTSVTADMGEGPIGPIATINLTGSNNKVNITNISVAGTEREEVAKRIYRTKANESNFYLLDEITSATLAYSDVLADTALGRAYVPVHAPPDDCRFVILGHDDRAYWFGRGGSNASLVDVSDVGYPDRIIDTEFLSVANNDGDTLQGAGMCPAGIVFFKRNSSWLLRAFNSPLANLHPKDKRGSGVGSAAPFSIVTTPVGLFFLSQRGEIYSFDGANIEEIGRKVSPEFVGMPIEAMGRVIACYHDYRYIISYDWMGSKGYNWKTLEYDIRTNKWEGPHFNKDYFTPSYYAVFDSAIDSGELCWGEAKASNGSYAYKRTRYNKTDRGNKFASTFKFQVPSDSSKGDIKTKRIIVLGKISQDTLLSATHISDDGLKTYVELNTPTYITGSKFNDGSKLGPSANVARFSGNITREFRGSFGPGARANIPTIEISDGGQSSYMEINQIAVLTVALPLK